MIQMKILWECLGYCFLSHIQKAFFSLPSFNLGVANTFFTVFRIILVAEEVIVGVLRLNLIRNSQPYYSISFEPEYQTSELKESPGSKLKLVKRSK
jgi:hypothetical protein